MESCPRCGAAIDEDASRCGACGAVWADASAPRDEPLPPLPDGGLAAALPTWLREPPAAAPAAPLLTEADLPPWLLALARRDDANQGAGAASAASDAPPIAPSLPRTAPLILPIAPLPTTASPPLESAPLAAGAPAARQSQTEPARRSRVGLATAVVLVLLALLILLAWASGVRLPGLS